jgi:hypothetical protein
LLDGERDFAAGLVDVAEAVGFVDNHQIPLRLLNVRLLAASELVRAENDRVLFERVQIPAAHRRVEGFRFEYNRGEVELIGQFLTPLLAEVRRKDHEHPSLPLCPLLRQ